MRIARKNKRYFKCDRDDDEENFDINYSPTMTMTLPILIAAQ